MFGRLSDTPPLLRAPMAGAAIQIGVFSLSIQVPAAESGLAKEVEDLYSSYPAIGPSELPDAEIALRYVNQWGRFISRKITTFLDGVQLYEPWPPRLGVPMLESAINSWMGKNVTRYLLMHSAVVERAGKALLLPGTSGVGKSTLSTVLAARGWRLLSDEVAVIRPNDGLVLPHPRPISLKNNSIDMMAKRFPDASISRRYEGTTKGTVAFLRPPEDAIERALEPAKPRLVVFPRFDPDGEPELRQLEKAPAFMRLVDNSPQYSTLLETGFETLATLVEGCEHYRLTYNNIDDAIALIEGLDLEARDGTS